MAKRKAKAKKANGTAKPANPKIEAGANRRAAAVLTRKLRSDIEAVEEKEQVLRKQKKNLFERYSADTGRSIVATKRILQLAKTDPTVRDTLVKDEIAVLEDLGMAVDMPLFADAAKKQATVDALETEASMPGYINGMGRNAFAKGLTLEQHPFEDDAKDAIARWEEGFIQARTEKDEADQRKREERQAARDARKAARDGEAESAAG